MLIVNKEVEIALADLAEHENLSIDDMIQRLIACYVHQNTPQNQTESSQLEIGREFMREYHQTFVELAK
jgi:hypothetical protein